MKRHLAAAFIIILLSVSLRAATVQITWNAVTTDANGQPVTGVTYNTYRSLNADMSAKARLNQAPIPGTLYDDTAAPLSTVYYQVHAVSSVGIEGLGSNIVSITPTGPPVPPSTTPTQVTGLTVVHKANLRWNATTTYTDGAAIVGQQVTYDVYKATRSDLANAVRIRTGQINPNYIDTSYIRKTRVWYYVKAVVNGVVGAQSTTVEYFSNRP